MEKAFCWVEEQLGRRPTAAVVAADRPSGGPTSGTALSDVDPSFSGILWVNAGAVLGSAKHDSLTGVTTDQHHAEVHEMLGTDHSDIEFPLRFYIIPPLVDGQVWTYDAANNAWFNATP
jgi:hypothetical protein